MPDLRADLERLDRRPYPAYKGLRGQIYEIGDFNLVLDHVQGDPFASPSRLRIDVPATIAGLPSEAVATPDARRAAADFLHRALLFTLSRRHHRSGSGKSGLLEIAAVGQEVLERTAVVVGADGGVTLRLTVGLPAAGRRILGQAAADLLTHVLPTALDAAATRRSLDAVLLRRHIETVEDQVALRAQLEPNGLVAFVAEASILARRSGVDDRPLADAVALAVPPQLTSTLTAPHAGALTGLGIRTGVTLIVGGGYHGKSTLLTALARGVYDHIPDDGRERAVTAADAVAVRAEDGRSVRGVDLRPFIRDLPLGRRTDAFSSDDASGSTSQAAAIIEALEAGATALLIDEDTAATNFMIRDARMRRLVPSAQEPITPYLDRVRQLADRKRVSSILVIGGAGDYLDVADTVIRMDAYRPADVTATARRVATELPLGDASPRAPGEWPTAASRVPVAASLDASRGHRGERVRGVKTRAIEFGAEEIDVSLLPQLIDPAQCRMIGDVLLCLAHGLADGRRSVAELLDRIDGMIADTGLAAVTDPTCGDRARARRFEIAAALNRLRSLRI